MHVHNKLYIIHNIDNCILFFLDKRRGLMFVSIILNCYFQLTMDIINSLICKTPFTFQVERVQRFIDGVATTGPPYFRFREHFVMS